jgi:hypothetical protein
MDICQGRTFARWKPPATYPQVRLLCGRVRGPRRDALLPFWMSTPPPQGIPIMRFVFSGARWHSQTTLPVRHHSDTILRTLWLVAILVVLFSNSSSTPPFRPIWQFHAMPGRRVIISSCLRFLQVFISEYRKLQENHLVVVIARLLGQTSDELISRLMPTGRSYTL